MVCHSPPRVANNVVRHRSILHRFSVANRHNGVIYMQRILLAHRLIRRGIEAIVHPMRVQPKVRRHVERHRHWSVLCHRLDDAVLIAGGYVVHPADLYADVAPINLVTDPILGLVLVGLLQRHPAVIVNVLECLGGQSTAASVIVEVAGTIDELLLGQALPVSAILGVADAVVRLEGARRAEGFSTSHNAPDFSRGLRRPASASRRLWVNLRGRIRRHHSQILRHANPEPVPTKHEWWRYNSVPP